MTYPKISIPKFHNYKQILFSQELGIDTQVSKLKELQKIYETVHMKKWMLTVETNKS